MAIQWKIIGFETAPLENGLENVVKAVHWWCENTTDEGSGWTRGVQQLELGSTFIDFNLLSEQQVLDWLFDAWVSYDENGEVIRDMKLYVENYCLNNIESFKTFSFAPW